MIGGVTAKPLLTTETLYPEGRSSSPGLVVVGSYVQKTTRQVERLRELPDMAFIEWDVTQAVTDHRLGQESDRVARAVQSAFARGVDACVFTTRIYHSDPDGKQRTRKTAFSFPQRSLKGSTEPFSGFKAAPVSWWQKAASLRAILASRPWASRRPW